MRQKATKRRWLMFPKNDRMEFSVKLELELNSPSLLNWRRRLARVSFGLGGALWFVALAFWLPTASASGAAWIRHTIDSTSQGADGVRIGDVNGDRLPDMATAWEEGGLVRVYLHPGYRKVRQPWPQVTVGKVQSPEDAVLADLDQDGNWDVISSCEGKTQTIFLHWAPRNPSQYLDASRWQTQAVSASKNRERWMFALPFPSARRDWIPLIAGSKGRRASVSQITAPLHLSSSGQTRIQRLYDAGWIMSLRKIDIDADGDYDVLASDRKGKKSGVLWLENPEISAPTIQKTAKERRQWKEHRIGAGGEEAMFLDARQNSAAKSIDIVVSAKPRQIFHFRAKQSDPLVWQARKATIEGKVGRAKALHFADVNNDGRLEVVASSEGASDGEIGVFWFPMSALSSPVIRRINNISGAEGTKFDRIETADLDGDGDLDVITCEEQDNLGVIWYENPTNKDN